MGKLVYLRQDAAVSETYAIEQKGERSWWVVCQPLAWDGVPLTTQRVVLFARSRAEAEAWVSTRQAPCGVGIGQMAQPARG